MKTSLSYVGTPEAYGYLFLSRSHDVAFVEIEEDMNQLNDYCVVTLEAVEATVQRLTRDFRSGKGGVFKDSAGESIELSDDQVRDGAAIEMDVWHDTSRFMAIANCLVLLACFTEKNLSHLCVAISGRLPKHRGGQSKVACCLEFLSKECQLTFTEPEESSQLREQCREIRNAFAHGDWQRTRDLVSRVELADAFKAVSDLFCAIEKAYEHRTKAP